jgi:hypothetical protein
VLEAASRKSGQPKDPALDHRHDFIIFTLATATSPLIEDPKCHKQLLIVSLARDGVDIHIQRVIRGASGERTAQESGDDQFLAPARLAKRSTASSRASMTASYAVSSDGLMTSA